MRIAWASPIGERSAIGRVSADVCRGLVEAGRQVTILATEMSDEAGPPHATPAPIRHWSQVHPDELRDSFDVLVVNFGDHYGFHGGAFRLLDILPTVGVFHDFFLFNLFMGWAADPSLHNEAPADIVAETEAFAFGGAAAADLTRAALRGEGDLAGLAAALPMTEWAARRCQGAFAHADFYLERLLSACPGPVARGRMPVTTRGVPPLRPRTGPVTCLTVGVMNPNKCVDQVIGAFARSPALQAGARYRLAGPIEPAEAQRLAALAQAAHCDLTILGAVSEAELQAELEGADIVCCLRKPVLEGSSGSAIEALLAGRPTVVAEAGFYAELPDEVVRKVEADLPPQALTACLEELAADPELRLRLGAEARAFAEETFALAPYVAALDGLLLETLAVAPQLAVGRRLGAELARLGVDRDDPCVAQIAALLEPAFGNAPPTRA